MLVASLIPMPRVDLDVAHGDKWLHVAAHATLAGYAWMLFRAGASRVVALGALVAFGVTIEALQAWLPWRSADAWDIGANLLGTLTGCVLAGTLLGGALRRVDGYLFATRGAIE